MALIVKLILPGNYKNSFLQEEFINGGAVYVTGDNGKSTTLSFGFQIIDSNTQLPVPINKIVSLTISNDELFQSNQVCLVQNWPSGGSYDNTIDYTVTLGNSPSTDQTFSTSGSPGSGTGLFKVVNWPLSGNGGLSTVYFSVTLEAANSGLDQVTYPGSFKIYDQILWESSAPSTPGVPKVSNAVVAHNTPYVGKKTLWRFAASTEGATGLYGNGVSRYLADIVEIRDGQIYSARSGGPWRTLAAQFNVALVYRHSPLTVSGYNSSTYSYQNPENSSYTSNSNVIGTSVNLTNSYSAAFYTSQIDLKPSNADFAGQTFFTLNNIFSPTVGFNIILKANVTPLTGGLSSAEEVGVAISCNNDLTYVGRCKSKIFRISGNSIVTGPEIVLPAEAYAYLTNPNGGNLEIFINNYTRPFDDHQMICSAYYTPQNGEESIFLGSEVCAGFNSVGPVGMSFEISASTTVANSSATLAALNVKEMAVASGAFALDADIGDCSTDRNETDYNYVTKLDVNWNFLSNQMMVLREAPSGDTGTLTTTVVDASNSYITLKAKSPTTNNARDYIELQALKPTFSDRFKITLNMQHSPAANNGEFYIAIGSKCSLVPESTNADGSYRPMGVRVDPSYGPYDADTNVPTLGIVFTPTYTTVDGDEVDSEIIIVQRRSDGTLSSQKVLSNWHNSTSAFFGIEVDNTIRPDGTNETVLTIGEQKTATGMFIDDLFLQRVVLTEPLVSAQSGFGFYTAIGARSWRNHSASVNVGFYGVKTLVPSYELSHGDLINQRHFLKANSSSSYDKSILGQKMLAGQTDFKGYKYLTPTPHNTATDIVAPLAPYTVRLAHAVSTTNVSSLSGLSTIDGHTLLDGEYVLLKDQTTPTENGLYVAHVGAWTKDDLGGSGGKAIVRAANGTINNNKIWSVIPDNTLTQTWFITLLSNTYDFEYFAHVISNGSNLSLTGSATVDGYSVSTNDVVLVKDQTNPAQNGLYIVNTAGAWTKISYTFDLHEYFYIANGTLHGGTLWYCSDTNSANLKFASTVFAQKISLSGINSLASIKPQLLELMLFDDISGVGRNFVPKIRIHSDNSGSIGSPITGWVSTNMTSLRPASTAGSLVPNNGLTQFDLGGSGWTASNGVYWVVVNMVPRTKLGVANSLPIGNEGLISSGTCKGWNLVNDLWYKVFAKYATKRDNVYPLAFLHLRLRSESYARMQSSASALSLMVTADTDVPGAVGKRRPVISQYLRPSVRTLALTINAIDSSDTDYDNSSQNTDYTLDTDEGVASDVIAFRIAKENTDGSIQIEPWQPWQPFKVDYKTIKYVTYLYGKTTQDIGMRRVWVQVMDGVGNITESYPITLLNKGVALVDTIPPTGTIEYIDPETRNRINASNNTLAHLGITGYDRVSGVKDVRIRGVNLSSIQPWDKWMQFNETIARDLSVATDGLASTDGLRRIEMQLRDYGNNANQPEPNWDVLYETATTSETVLAGNIKHRGVTFVASTKWTPPEGVNSVFLSGIKHEEFGVTDRYILVDSKDSSYINNKAYKIVCDEMGSGSFGRVIYARDKDVIAVYKNGSMTEFVDYTLDTNRGLIIFNSQQLPSDTYTVQVKRNSAILCAWDGVMPVQIADLGHLGERVILSLYGNDNQYLLLGGESGNIWLYDGRIISGPIYNTTSNTGTSLPITLLFEAQFSHEETPYVYAGTGVVPRLFRALKSAATAGSSWSRVQPTGVNSTYLSASNLKGDLLSYSLAYNTIFLGTSDGKVLQYNRRLVYTNSSDETEKLNESVLENSNVNALEGAVPRVQCMLTAGGQVFAGLGDRPEVWSYTAQYLDNPINPNLWHKITFNKDFFLNPSPAQFYTTSALNGTNLSVLPNNISITNPVNNQLLTWNSMSDKNSQTGYKESVTILSANGGLTSFTWNKGSDWENAMSLAYSSATTGNVKFVMTSPLVAPSGNKTIDGQVTTHGDRVLVAQSVSGFGGSVANGIYVVNSNGAWTLASDVLYLHYNVFVTNGVKYSGTYFVLSDVARKVWSIPSYTLETELMSATATRTESDGRQGINVSDGYYNWDLQIGTDSLTLTSGTNSVTALYAPSQNAVSMFNEDTSGQIYAQRGYSKLWSFSKGTREDTGPYWSGDNNSDSLTNGSAEGWVANQNVGALSFNTSAEYTSTRTGMSTSLVVPFNTFGNPRIIWNTNQLSESPIQVNTQTKFFIRFALTADATLDTLPKGRVKISWSESASETIFEHWTTAEFAFKGTYFSGVSGNITQYVTLALEPAWAGSVSSIAVEFELDTDSDSVRSLILNALIDYMAVANDGFGIAFKDTMTPVRVCVTGRRVQVYAGKYENPLIDQPMFLSLPSNTLQIALGKISLNESGNSAWAWAGYRFIVGSAIPPVIQNVQDFALQWRFPSTGGVRQLLIHRGTAWALTDGLNTNIDTDNPDDRTSKCYSYNAANESWSQEAPPYPRRADKQGVIRPLCATSYKGTLIIGSQHAPVRS